MTARKRYWLMKSEPDAFSIDDLQRVGTEPWNGVRNYQARNFMRDGMKEGDGVLFYHSNPKATREQPRWFLVDVAFERKLGRTIALEEIKQHADELGEAFPLVARGNRLSVFPVTAAQWKLLLSLE